MMIVRRVTEITLLQQFEVYTADGGEAGLKLAEAKTPDVILLDVRMPNWRSCAQIRLQQRFQLYFCLPVFNQEN